MEAYKLPHCGGISLVYPHNKPLANAKDFFFFFFFFNLFCVAFIKYILLHSEMPSKQAWHLQSSTVFSTWFLLTHIVPSEDHHKWAYLPHFAIFSCSNCKLRLYKSLPRYIFIEPCEYPMKSWNLHFISPDEIPMKPDSLRRFYGWKEENSAFTVPYLCQSQRFIEFYIYLTKSDGILK